jgi:hypothetical protein
MLLRTLRKIGPWLAFVLAWIIAHKWMSDIAATGLAVVVWLLSKVFVGCLTTPEAEIREALDSGKPERIKAAFELASARESGDKERVKAAIDALAKAIRNGT